MNEHLIYRRDWPVGLLIILTIIAAILRLYGIRFGLPFTYHVDEPTYISAALNLGAGNIGRQLNPPVLPNILFLEFGVYYIFERMSGNISSVAEFEKLYRMDPSMFFLLGRLTTAFMGVLNVLIIYLVGRKASNQLAGILAALFLALSFLHVRDSHFAVPDVMMTLLVTTSILFCLLAIKESNRKYLYIAAFFSGMAIASKWSAWPVIIPLGYVFILKQYRTLRDFSISRVASYAGVVLFCLLAGFFLPAFQLLLKPGSYLAYALTELRSGASGGFGIWQVDTVPGYIFYLKTLWYGVGTFLLAFGVIGFLMYIWLAFTTRNETSFLLILFPLAYYLIMGATRHYFARYTLPLVPFLVLFAGEVMIAVAAQAELRWRKMGWVLLSVLVFAASAQSLLNSLRFDSLMTRVDTRTSARNWIEKNIPKGSKIALDWPIHTPFLSTDNYDITVVGEIGLANHSIKYYQEEGFDYLIASSYIYEIPLVIKEIDISRKAFYNSLENETELIKEFKPSRDSGEGPFIFDEIYGPFISLWQREQPGPTLKIYYIGD